MAHVTFEETPLEMTIPGRCGLFIELVQDGDRDFIGLEIHYNVKVQVWSSGTIRVYRTREMCKPGQEPQDQVWSPSPSRLITVMELGS